MVSHRPVLAVKRYLIRLSTGEHGIGVAKRPNPRRPAHNVFSVRVRGRVEDWPDYDVYETSRWHWWFSRMVGG